MKNGANAPANLPNPGKVAVPFRDDAAGPATIRGSVVRSRLAKNPLAAETHAQRIDKDVDLLEWWFNTVFNFKGASLMRVKTGIACLMLTAAICGQLQ